MNGCVGGFTGYGGGGAGAGVSWFRDFRRRDGAGADVEAGADWFIGAESALVMVAGETTACVGGCRGSEGSSLSIWRNDMEEVAGGRRGR